MILTQPSNLNRHRLTDIVNSAASIYTSLFAQRRQSSLLFAVNELVRSFGNDKSCTQAICLSVEEVILRTAATLQTLSDFDDAPDVVDDAFLLVKTCLKYCPKALANPQIVASTLDMLICGLHVQHREACCSMLDFTRNLLYARNEDLVDILGQVLPPRGGALVRSLLAGALGALPSSRVSDITGVIAALLGQNLSIHEASLLGVAVHAKAGEIYANKYGEIGLNATALIPIIRKLLNK